MNSARIGQPVRRKEDLRLVTGSGSFTDDLNLPNQARGYVLRSPHANARINSLDTSVARAKEGVLAVFTAESIKTAGLGTIPCLSSVTQRDGSPMVKPIRPILADKYVRHVGNAVAFIVAETLSLAKDAAEEIDIDYDPLPAVTDTHLATDDGMPQVWPEAKNNICYVWETGDQVATSTAFETAAHIVELRVVNNRVMVAALEPRAAIGQWDGHRYTLYAPTQGVHGMRRQLANHIFSLPEEKFRIVTPDVGGSFGMKNRLYPELPLVLLAAQELKRPVKWTADRSESFLSDTQGRDQINHAKLALDAQGIIQAIRIDTKYNVGAYLSQFGPAIAIGSKVALQIGAYNVPCIFGRVTGVFTNTVPVDAYRGAGRPEAGYIIERLIDAGARKLQMEPADFRRQNFINTDSMPHTTALGLTYDSGDFNLNLNQALSKGNYIGFNSRRIESESVGKLRGCGIAYHLENSSAGAQERTLIRVDPVGTITIIQGTQSGGQGHSTVFPQIVADRLGLEIECIELIQGDTDLIPSGSGTGGSKSAGIGGVSCDRAAVSVIEKGRLIASRLLEVAPLDIEYVGGLYKIAGTDRSKTLFEIAAAVTDNPDKVTKGDEAALIGYGEFGSEVASFANGCHLCEVEIDPETGTIDILSYKVVSDFGTIINPLLTVGQVHGGVAQGLGQALLENCIYENNTGQLLSGSFMDYSIPRASDLPFMDVTLTDGIPSLTNPMGIKGAGESGTVGAPPAFINAVLNALANFGVDNIDMPALPEKIWTTVNKNYR